MTIRTALAVSILTAGVVALAGCARKAEEPVPAPAQAPSPVHVEINNNVAPPTAPAPPEEGARTVAPPPAYGSRPRQPRTTPPPPAPEPTYGENAPPPHTVVSQP